MCAQLIADEVFIFIFTEIGGIAIIVEHGLKDLPSDNFPSKPFFGVDPVIIDYDQVSMRLIITINCHYSEIGKRS